MSEIRVLGENAVRRLLTMDETLEAVEQTYLQKAGGEAEVFPMVFHEFEAGKADMDIKSGVMKKFGVYGLKLVSWFGENPGKNLPALFGTTLLFDSETGRPTALLDAEYITAMRTGAAGAIGSKFLARKDSESLLMVGTGHQA
jgi:ornithine cyclodeaminase/alanine dehydrogenase